MDSIGLYALLALGIGLVCGLITNVIVRIVRRRSASAANTSDDFDEDEAEILKIMRDAGYVYDPDTNQFK